MFRTAKENVIYFISTQIYIFQNLNYETKKTLTVNFVLFVMILSVSPHRIQKFNIKVKAQAFIILKYLF